jgi:glycosyltransferase involved in cell wall biosynthesis
MRYHALLLTLDEERQVRPCLDSLADARSVVVVDSGSRDRTPQIVAGFPSARLLARPFTTFADQRNFGLAAFDAGEWVLHLDADERLTPELRAELRTLEPSAESVAYNLAALTFLGGRPLRRAAGLVYQTRLTRAGAFAFEQVGHGQKAPAHHGVLPCLRAPYEHHPFEKGWDAWEQRHRRYARDEAADLLAPATRPTLGRALRDPIARRQLARRLSARLPLRPALVWAYLLLVRGGLLDGRAGREYARRRRLYESWVVEELRRQRAARARQ